MQECRKVGMQEFRIQNAGMQEFNIHYLMRRECGNVEK
jgi:hypothetical protein